MKTQLASWDDLRILLAVHRHESFLAAGKTLGVAASTIARRVEAIERSLGRVLVHRGNDDTRLDPDALRLVALAEELELGLASLVRDGRDAMDSQVRSEPLHVPLELRHRHRAGRARRHGHRTPRCRPGDVLPGLVQLDIEQAPPPVEVFLAFRRDARKTPRIRVVAREIEADARRQIR